MNPQELSSLLSTALGYALAAASTALVTKGVMTTDQANALVPELSAVILGVGAIGVGWWKKNQHSPAAVATAVAETPAVASAVVDTVNTEAVPGVKVVASSSPSPPVALDAKGNVKP